MFQKPKDDNEKEEEDKETLILENETDKKSESKDSMVKYSKDPLLKGKGQYSWPPCIN